MAQIFTLVFIGYVWSPFFLTLKGKFPWPLANRDYVFNRRGKYYDDKKTYVSVGRATNHDQKPEVPKVVRVDTYLSAMALKDNGEKGSLFRFWYYDDLKGSIPKMVINWYLTFTKFIDRVIGSAIPEFLKKMADTSNKYPDEKLKKFIEESTK